jgi:hypothetical protein
MPASDALALLATHVKPDSTYQPLKDEHSRAGTPARHAASSRS